MVTLVVADLQIEGGEEVEQFLGAVARECSREIGQREEQRLDLRSSGTTGAGADSISAIRVSTSACSADSSRIRIVARRATGSSRSSVASISSV